jgi:hypothetical protein
MNSITRFAISLVFSALALFGQAFTGTITGTVTDPNGAAVPGAAVRARNEATNDTRQQAANSDGLYTFSQLPPGTYEVTVEMQGFRKAVQTATELRVNQTLELNIALQLGEVSQTVEVSAGVTLLDTQSANRAVTLDQRAVLDLPSNTRNPFQLVHVNAGVIAVRTGIAQSTQDQNHNRFSMNGGRGQAGLTLIDGVPAAAVDWGGLIASPGMDAVQEVNITRNQFDAQFGKSDGGAVNMITRGGSNDFHGSLFEYLRNNKLDANSWANNRAGIRRPVFQRHQFGATLGGPIWKANRLFFFAGYEGRREGVPGTNISTVPTELQRMGDFSQTFNANGTQAVIYNPFSTRPNPDRPGEFIRDPFPGNRIPANLIDPVAARVVAAFPRPNTQGVALTNALNFAAAGKTVTVNDRLDTRIDWAKSEKMSIFGRLTKAWQQNTAPVFFGGGADTNFSDVNPRHHVVIGTTLTPTPTWVVNLLVGSGRWRENQISPSQGFDATTLGFSQSLASQFQAQTFPAFSSQGYASLGNRRWLNFARETHNLQANISKELGSHSLRFGWMTEVARINSTDFNSPSFSFNRGITSGPLAATASTTSGDAIASLLLGVGSGGDFPFAAATAVTANYHGAYMQDSWRATRRLTLNLGLRWEAQPGRTERYNRFNNFDFQVASPLAQQTGLPLKGGLVFVAPGQGSWDTDWLNLAPRFGMAYKVTDRIVMRGGYGIYYPQSGGGTNQGFSTTSTWVSTTGGDGINPNPAALLRNPFPNGITAPAGASRGLLTQVGDSVSAFSRHHPLGYVQNFSFDIQTELREGMVLEIGYTGSQGRKLLYGTGQQANQLHPDYLSLGAQLDQPVPNPFFGVIPTGILSGPTVPRQRLLRPYPQFTAVNLSGDTPGASSSFNALVARYNWRIGNSLNLLTTYQWSKAIDNASEWQGWEVGDTMRNFYDQRADRSISAHDLPQSFVNALVYELPVGKGRKIGSDLHPVANAIIGGWQISSIVRLSSGLPLGFTAPNTLSAYGFQVQRPNIANLKDAKLDNPTPDRWFNTAAFSRPGTYEIGNAPRWFPNVRFGPTRHADIALLKNFRFFETWKAQLRGEFFNITNTPQFARANTDISSGDFGRVSGTTNVGPRNIQLGLRIQF